MGKIKILDTIEGPQSLKGLSAKEREQLAAEIRQFILEKVSKSGGHLASNLGSVEIAIAVHTVLDSPKDKIIWDTGHQAYPHKILTVRKDKFDTLRQMGGISGFPRREESEHDVWGVGHGGTGLSAALGFAVARNHLKRDEGETVCCIVGDAALEEGMAWEALHNIGALKPNLIIILNDNGMSIAPSVGALENYLRKLRLVSSDFLRRARSEPRYLRLKEAMESFLSRSSTGKIMLEAWEHFANTIKEWVIPPGMVFEELGFTYLGSVDGHDTEVLIECINEARVIGGPVIIHALTQKGKGYSPAEKDPWHRHTTVPFDIATGEHLVKEERPPYTSVFSKTLIRLAEQDERIVAITAAMPDGTGMDKFAERFPQRFYDVGMAEQHAVGFAAALAFAGLKPVVAIYSTFLQRAFDQIIHDVCLQKAPIVLCLDRAGIVGEDGHTHQGIFDVSYLRLIPNIIIMAPKDENELQHMLYTALQHRELPVALRYPRGAGVGVPLDSEFRLLEIGKAEWLKEGQDAVVVALGGTVHPSLEAATALELEGWSLGVINARFVKPLDAGSMLEAAERTRNVITVEENVCSGGFGSAVLELLHDNDLHDVTVHRISIPDRFVEHAKVSQLRSKYGLDYNGLVKTFRKHLKSHERAKAY